jgi:hypothetical protein
MDAATVEELGKVLKALASESRIALLVALQRPLRLSEIDLTPSREGWGPGDRTVSRQAVRNQLRILEGLGVVRALTDDGETRYVVHHARLYEVTERLRELATVRPEVDVAHETISMRSPNVAPRPTGAHLVLVRGVREGQVFPLAGESPEQGWLIGRAKEAPVALDYDPYVSTAHARVLPRGDGHALVDLPSNRNRTFLNWNPIARGAVAPLQPGDLIGVGMSLLVYRR